VGEGEGDGQGRRRESLLLEEASWSKKCVKFLYFTRLSLTNIYHKITMPRRNRKMAAVV